MNPSFIDQSLYGSFIHGEFVLNRQNTKPHDSIVLKRKWKNLSPATPKQIQAALKSAEEGLNHLKLLSPYERANFLKEIADLLLKHKDEMAQLITLEMGKTIKESRGEVEYAAGYFRWFSEEAKRIYGYSIPSSKPKKELIVRYEPIGIVAVMTPWNFPLAMAGRKIAPAIAAGCSVIARPSSTTPLTLLFLAYLTQKLKLPPGALNVLIGDAELISQDVLASPKVRKFTFTGSCETGETLYRQCAPTFKKATLELGGHAPLIVFADADLDKAIEETIAAKFRLSGQTCICANRLLVQKEILPTFVKKLKNAVSRLKIGDPRQENTQLTNVLHPTSYEKIKRHIADALKKGAKPVLIGKEAHEPTILKNVDPSMIIFREETFGPVAAITSFSKEEEAISLANDSIYGLASYLFTQNLSQAERVISKLEYGIIGLNDGLPSTPEVPFGGIKYSGFGREGGPHGIYEYLMEKLISKKYG